MRIAIVSDTHFGDPMCALATLDAGGRAVLGPKYAALRDAVRAGGDGRAPADYLVLLGDILDFSIASYEEAFRVAKFFFLTVQQDGLAREIIYVPGNHDFELWHTVEYETNVINRLQKGRDVRAFRMSVPGIVDDRSDAPSWRRGLTLFGVTPGPQSDGGREYAGLFMDAITGTGSPLPFNFAYPNLYIVTDDGAVLLTHGQYLEPYWALLGEWAPRIAGRDLQLTDPVPLRDVVGLNFPLSQLACSGIGQAGPLTRVVRTVEHEVKAGSLDRIMGYLDRLHRGLDDAAGFPFYLKWLVDLGTKIVKSSIRKGLGGMEEARYNQEFLANTDVEQRFWKFYEASVAEIAEINLKGYEIPPPATVIFGHTHEPTGWRAADAPRKRSPRNGRQTVTLYNTGGWLFGTGQSGAKEFCGAQVFVYASGTGFSSTAV